MPSPPTRVRTHSPELHVARGSSPSSPAPSARSKAGAGEKRSAIPARATRRRLVIVGSVIGLVLVGSLFAFVYPTRTYLDQRAEMRSAEERLSILRDENARLAREAERLQSDEAVERIAREQYGLLRPGERAFVIVPVPTTTAPPPSTTVTSAPEAAKGAKKKSAG